MNRIGVLGGVLGLLAVVAGYYYVAGDAMEFVRESPSEKAFREAKARNAANSQGSTTSPAKRPIAHNATVDESKLLHELPRQALFIHASLDLHAPTLDRAIDFAGVTSDLSVAVASKYSPVTGALEVTLTSEGRSLEVYALPVSPLAAGTPDYSLVAAKSEVWSLMPEKKGLLSAPPATMPARVTESANASIESSLGRIDVPHGMLAARQIHQVITQEGASLERLVQLVRAYANLGEATRQLLARHRSVFFARAAVLAERLVREHPESSIAHAARGYAYTLIGMPSVARAAFEQAHALDGNATLPDWAVAAESLNQFKTRELFDLASASTAVAPLASYFTMLSVEHSGLKTVTVNAAKLASHYNPTATRPLWIIDIDSMADAFSAGNQFENAQKVRLESLAADPSVPGAIRRAAADVVRQGGSPSSWRTLFNEMNAEPGEAGQMLPWGAFASVWCDELFAAQVRVLTCERYSKNEMGSVVAHWWPLFKDHRFATMFAGFDPSRRLGNAAGRNAVASLGLMNLYGDLHDWSERAKTADRAEEKKWLDTYEFDDDLTVYDSARELWQFRDADADRIELFKRFKGQTARKLMKIAPEHPIALSESIVNEWSNFKDRTADIEEKYGSNPQVAFALARAFHAHDRDNDAVRVLESLIETFPERSAYELLAEIYEQRGDREKWIAAMEKYLAGSEDFGIDHARANQKIAESFMRAGAFDKALKYAAAAAKSGHVACDADYIGCLTALGRYDEAERHAKKVQSYAPHVHLWLRWCLETDRGDLEGAKLASAAAMPQILAAGEDGHFADSAAYFEMIGEKAKAREQWQRNLDGSDASPIASLSLALLDLELGKVDEAKERLNHMPQFGGMSEPPQDEEFEPKPNMADTDLRGVVYGVARAEMLRCLDDPNAVPTRQGYATAILRSRGKAYRATSAYSLGRLCEIRNKPEDAAWWYEVALDASWGSTTRALAAQGLRRVRSGK